MIIQIVVWLLAVGEYILSVFDLGLIYRVLYFGFDNRKTVCLHC